MNLQTRSQAQSPAGPASRLDRFHAAALQMPCDGVHEDRDREAAAPRMQAAIARIERHIGGAKRWIGPDLKLVVLPEYVLTGPPWGESIPEWTAKAALDPDGPEYAGLAAIAARHSVFLAGNAYETDVHFPGLYFQCSFVFDDQGRRILSYRRLISMFAPTPYDVWDRYLDLYGLEAVFPVADTTIGRLAAIASEEILYPEIARCHAVRGAEIFLHSSSETGALTLTPKQIARRARALENLAYLVSANTASIEGIDVPRDSGNGFSDIIDYLGNQIIQAGFGESMVANCSLDLAGLRAWRARPGMGNLLSRQALDLFAEVYASADLRRRNGLLDGGRVVIPERSYFQKAQAEVLARMQARFT
jgi:predicted amidohydrolase